MAVLAEIEKPTLQFYGTSRDPQKPRQSAVLRTAVLQRDQVWSRTESTEIFFFFGGGTRI
jgi:hypothetical protein